MTTRREAAIEAILAQQQEKREELERLRAALEETEQDMVELDTAMAGLESSGIGGDVIVNVPQQPAPEINVSVPTPEVNVNVPAPEVNVAAPQVTINPEINITGLVDLINRITALESRTGGTSPVIGEFQCSDLINCQEFKDLEDRLNQAEEDIQRNQVSIVENLEYIIDLYSRIQIIEELLYILYDPDTNEPYSLILNLIISAFGDVNDINDRLDKVIKQMNVPIPGILDYTPVDISEDIANLPEYINPAPPPPELNNP